MKVNKYIATIVIMMIITITIGGILYLTGNATMDNFIDTLVGYLFVRVVFSEVKRVEDD